MTGLLASPTRVPDPYTKVVSGWSIRRLAPDSGGIDIDKIDHVDDQRALLRSMGSELANIHLTKADPAVLLEYVRHDSRHPSESFAVRSEANGVITAAPRVWLSTHYSRRMRALGRSVRATQITPAPAELRPRSDKSF